MKAVYMLAAERNDAAAHVYVLCAAVQRPNQRSGALAKADRWGKSALFFDFGPLDPARRADETHLWLRASDSPFQVFEVDPEAPKSCCYAVEAHCNTASVLFG